MADFIYIGLVVAQVFTFCAYIVVTAGAALLQRKANTLTLFDGLDDTQLAATTNLYNSVFAQSTYIAPYPQRPEYQFQYEWWIIEFEGCIFFYTLFLTLFPKFLPRGRLVALAFLATALVQVMDNINAVFYLLRSDIACQVFQKYRIQTAQAGLIMVGIANGFTIIFMGLYEAPITERINGTDVRVVVVPDEDDKAKAKALTA